RGARRRSPAAGRDRRLSRPRSAPSARRPSAGRRTRRGRRPAASAGASPRTSDLREQVRVVREALEAAPPRRERLLLLAVLRVEVAEEAVGRDLLRRERGVLLLLHQDLELVHRLALPAEERRRIRERERLAETRVPVVVVELERAIERLLRLLRPRARHRPDP